MTRAYEYRGNHYCAGHVSWMLNTLSTFSGYMTTGGKFGWSHLFKKQDMSGLWKLLADYDDYVEVDLDALAEHYGIDREAVTSDVFPVPLPSIPRPPTFCSDCLWWFDPPEEEEEDE